MITRRNFTKIIGLGTAGIILNSACSRYRMQSDNQESLQPPSQSPLEPRPNILIIYVDDLALGDVGAFGCPDCLTPNIDALAASGVKLTNAYTINAPCSPSRTGLIMGMYTQRFGKYDLSRGVPIPEDKPTMAETLRDAGYVTGFVGAEKWDIGSWEQGPLDRGFMEMGMHPPRVEGKEYFGGGSSYMGVDGSYLTEVEGQYVLEFLERHGKRRDKPFFLYFTPLAVHVPTTEVSQEYLKRLSPDDTDNEYSKRQYLLATLLVLDDQIGRIVQKLRELGIENNTLIMFSSDNGGDPKADYRSAPYRGGKGRENMQWEGNYRMPTIVSFPGTLPAEKEYKGMISTMDFYATAVAVANTYLPEDCEGKNLLPLLMGKENADSDEALFWNTQGTQAARWKQWRIVKYGKEQNWRLYDIEKDPAEQTDLAAQNPEIVREMDKRYQAWLKQMPPPLSPVKPPQHLLAHTRNGNHARRPFGRGWMTAEEWGKIKDDPTRWSEMHMRPLYRPN